MPYMGLLKQSTGVTKTVLMIDSADHITGKTGLSAGITKYVTKAAGTPTATTITTSELDATNVKGLYSLAFSSSDVDTLGDFQLHLTATGADPADYWWYVSATLPGDSDESNAISLINTYIDAAITSRLAGASYTAPDNSSITAIKTQTDKLTFDSDNYIEADARKINQSATAAGYVDAAISSRMATFSYTAPDNTNIGLIKAQTDKLTYDSDNYVESHPMTGVTVTTNNDKIGYALTSAYDPAKTASQDSDMQTALTSLAALPTATDNADALLKRDWTSVTGEASRSVLNALRAIRNKFSTTASPGFVTIYKEDDTTAAYTKALTTDSDANPIVEG